MQPRIGICGPDPLGRRARRGSRWRRRHRPGLLSQSPRYVELAQAATLARAVPPLVTIVGLFVNADPAQVRQTLAAVPIHLLQFHGDEDEAYCRQFDRPYLKAARVT